MESVKKADLITQVAEKSGLSKADTLRAVESLQSVVIESVAGGKKVSLPGFLSLEPSTQAARTGRNPRTGEELSIPERRSVRVRILKAFKDSLK